MRAESPLILLVIGDDQLRHSAGGVLAGRGYRVRLSGAVANVCELVEQASVSCAVLDTTLAGQDLTELLATLHGQWPELPVLLVQGDASVRAALNAMSSGAREYLPGPLEPFALASAVERILGPLQPDVEPPARVSRCVEAAEAPDLERARVSQRVTESALEWLVDAMEAKDPHLPGHSLRVAELAASIATRMGRADWEVEEVRLAGRLHDIGMIAIGDGILTKEGPLTAEEYAEVKRHPVLGDQILRAYPNMERVASYVRGHHERWDGGGYPDRLAGESIPWGARVLAAAENFDALTSSRSYRSARSVVEALERMFEVSADAMDPAVMRALQRVVSRRETLCFIREDDLRTVERDLLAMEEPTGAGGARVAG